MSRETEAWYEPILMFFREFDEGYFVASLMVLAALTVVCLTVDHIFANDQPVSPQEARSHAFAECMHSGLSVKAEDCIKLLDGVKDAKSNPSRP
jgi:hypothetical protein